MSITAIPAPSTWHIKRLREKLEGASDQWGLKTVWGVGYKFEVKE